MFHVNYIISNEAADLYQTKRPEYATPGSAAVDLRVVIPEGALSIEPGQSIMRGTGLSIHIKNPTTAGLIIPRSGLGAKKGLVISNLVGLIDSDYQGEIGLSLWNRGTEDTITVNNGDRVAQLIFMPVEVVRFSRVDEFLEESVRAKGGFGSTEVR